MYLNVTDVTWTNPCTPRATVAPDPSRQRTYGRALAPTERPCAPHTSHERPAPAGAGPTHTHARGSPAAANPHAALYVAHGHHLPQRTERAGAPTRRAYTRILNAPHAYMWGITPAYIVSWELPRSVFIPHAHFSAKNRRRRVWFSQAGGALPTSPRIGYTGLT